VGGEKRGAALGLVASALMIGVAVGSPLGGWLVTRSPGAVYYTAAALLLVAAVASLAIPSLPVGTTPVAGRRYAWVPTSFAAWMPLAFGFVDRFTIGVFVSTFTLYLSEVVGISPTARGVLMSLFMLPFALLCWPLGRLADRTGWYGLVIAGTLAFGVLFATYGLVPSALLPVSMILSGLTSAMMFSPNLLLVSEFARRGAGEGVFGAFQIAGSLGFLVGPMVGGIAVEITRRRTGVPAYDAIFIGVGLTVVVLGVIAALALHPVARAWQSETK
jgi:MFS family permease